MAWSNGVYSRLYSWVTDRDNAIKVRADRMDGEFDEIVTALNALTSGGVSHIAAMKGYSGTVSLPGYAFDGDLNSGFYRIGADNVGVAVNGTKIVDVDTAGMEVTGTLDASKGADVASAATLNLDTATGMFPDITGTTTVTAVTLAAGKHRTGRARGAFQITASANLIVNGSTTVNYSAADGDVLIFEGYASSVVRVTAIRGGAASSGSRRNRIVNPAMQISQENGNTSGTTTGYYIADQFAMYRVTSAGTITGQRVQSQTIYKSKDRARITITAADATLAAGEYLTLNQNIEGQEVAAFAYGAAGARQSVLRFGFKGPSGTYAVSIKNSALNRSYVATFSPASANTDEMISLVIPGDTSGTWLTDTGIGLSIDFVFACGSTFQGTTGWQSGNYLGTSGVSNGMGTISQVFEIFDVGLYLDAESTGVAPAWELPDYDDTLRQCQNYVRIVEVGWVGNAVSGQSFGGSANYNEMRATPTATFLTNIQTGAFPATVGTFASISAIGFNYFKNATSSSASTQFRDRFLMNARM